jgi:hypothetical protein
MIILSSRILRRYRIVQLEENSHIKDSFNIHFQAGLGLIPGNTSTQFQAYQFFISGILQLKFPDHV